MCPYSVRQLAELAAVSVRTLHHYDRIGLLVPATRTAAGYRQYEEVDLLRLQQILFYRELDFRLDDIRRMLDDPAFDAIEALHDHRRMLHERAERLNRLLNTVDKTIRKLEGDGMPLTDKELYEGFDQETIDRYKREVRERYDPKIVAESDRRVKGMSKGQWDAVKAEGDEVSRGLAALMDRQPTDPEVQALIARHHAWIENFYPCSAEMYVGLGRMYAEHAEFRAHYDQYAEGLADFMRLAMTHYADTVLA